MTVRALRAFLFVLGFIALRAAGAHADASPGASGSPFAAPADKARVVLIRERMWNRSSKYRVIDGSSRCLSAVAGKRHAVFDLSPGSHELYVIVPTTRTQAELLKLRVSAGRTYVIDLASQALRKRNVEAQTVRPNTEEARLVAGGMKRTKRYEPDLGRCDEWLVRKADELPRKLEHARQQWNTADENYRESHTLRAEDGFVGEALEALFGAE